MRYDSDKTVVRGSAQRSPGMGLHGAEAGVNVLPVGTRVGEFEITDIIGEGGFGIVYLAYDHSLERHVALKEYMPGSLASRTHDQQVTVKSQHHIDTFAAGLRSFVNEAKLLAQFDSPSLVKVYRFWEANGTAYMVMPFYDGITLKQALKERRIVPTEEWIKGLLGNLFDAVETIHRVRCYHRDIAPDNILLLKNGHPVLLDFGAARRVIGDLTQGPTVILKPGFAPIEQYADIPGLKQGPWTDVYALAAVVYFLLTGKSPPPAVSRVVHDDMVPAREVGRGRYSAPFLVALDRALAVRPENRIQTVAGMRRELQIEETMARTMPLREKPAALPAEEKPKPDSPVDGLTSFHQPAAATPAAEWMKTMSTEKRDMSPLKRPGKGTIIALGIGLFAGIAGGMIYWRAVVSPQHGDVAVQKPVPQLETRQSRNRAKEEALPERAAAPEPSATPSTPSTPLASSTPSTPSASSTPSTPLASQAPAPPAVPAQQSRAGPPAGPAPPASATVSPVPPVAGSLPPADTSPRPPSEDDLWKAARKSGKSGSYTAYLTQYPNGKYADAARQRLERDQAKLALAQPGGKAATSPLEQAKPATSSGDSPSSTESASSKASPSSPEEELWTIASALNQAPAYETYLNRYPSGAHAQTARDKLAKFKPPELSPPTPSSPIPKPQAERPPSEKPLEKAPDKPASAPSTPSTPSTPSAPPAEPPAAGPKVQPAEPGRTASEPPVARAKRTYKLADQTMTGEFEADPATGIVSGRGKIVWNNGDQFEGTLVRGVKEGKGQFSWANGQRYSGDWARDKPNGKGTIQFANGNRYEGDVHDGTPQGRGKFFFVNGNRYEGDVKDGAPHGKGIIHFTSGDRYEGEVRAGLQHGEGIGRFKRGDVYAGSWVNGKSEGRGRYTWANGTYWEGEFRDGTQTENGTLVRVEDATRGTARASGAGGDASAATSSQAAGAERGNTKP